MIITDSTRTEIISQFSECLNDMDWENIHAVMKLTNWTWCFAGGGCHVPTVDELQQNCENLFWNVLRHLERNPGETRYWMETGGFRVTISCVRVNIEFVFNHASRLLDIEG